MNALRNVSRQPLIFHRAGGALVHLLPKRAVALADEELRSPQVTRLIADGLAQTEQIIPDGSPAKAPKGKSTKPQPQKSKAAEHKAPEKKKT